MYAEEQGNVVGYCTFHQSGRVGYPWCLPGNEDAAEPLFAQTLQTMKQRGIRKAFSAYRQDWPTINEFFQKHGFRPWPATWSISCWRSRTCRRRPPGLSSRVTPATVARHSGIFALDPPVFRVAVAEALKEALWNNPYFPADSFFVLRNRADGTPQAAGHFHHQREYADPRAVDAAMPCFRLGAFGTEGMTTKRVKGTVQLRGASGQECLHRRHGSAGYAVPTC